MSMLRRILNGERSIHDNTLEENLMPYFIFSLPHLIACSIISLFYLPEIFGIFLVGWIVPDIIPVVQIHSKPSYKRQNNYPNFKKVLRIRRLAHIATLLLSLILLYYGFTGMFIAGISHILLDLIGF